MSQEMFDRLAAPFAPERVSWRVGSTTGDKARGMALAYIDARDVMDRLDTVCGPAGWQCDYPHANGKTVCRVGLKVDGEWIWKSDGAGDTDYEAEKGALSDAFKRAAVRWGVGRYLYDIPAPWVEVDQRGKSYVIKEAEYGKLRALLERYGSEVKAPPPAPIQAKVRKSSAQAKRDGDDARIKEAIAKLDAEGVRRWREDFDQLTADQPMSWLDSIHNMLDLRQEELESEGRAADGQAENEEAFRATMGSPSPSRVAGDNSGRKAA